MTSRIFGVLRFIGIIALACIIVDTSNLYFGFQRDHNPTFPHSVHHKHNTILQAAETEQASGTTDQDISSNPINEDNKRSTNLLTNIPSKLQNLLGDSGTLRSIINIAPHYNSSCSSIYYKNPHCFPEFIRISEYLHWLATSTSRIMNNVFNITGDPDNRETVIASDISSRVNFQKENFGSHPKQVGQVMVKEEVVGQKDLPLFIFLHDRV